MRVTISQTQFGELLATPYRLHAAGEKFSRSLEHSNEMLDRLRERGITTLYGELLRTADELLYAIPFRPQIGNTGCEVLRCGERAEWLLLWEVRQQRDGFGSTRMVNREVRRSLIDVLHMVDEREIPSLDRTSIADLFEVPLKDCVEGLWEQEWNIQKLESTRFEQNKQGKMINRIEGRHELRRQLVRSGSSNRTAFGLELELCLAETLYDSDLWFRAGIETPFGELDALVSILDSLVLFECKDTKSIGVRDIQVLVSRAASIGAEYAFLLTTMSSKDLHTNVRETLEQFRRSGPVYVMALFVEDISEDIPSWLATVCDIVGSEMLYHWIKADESYYKRSPLWRVDAQGRINGRSIAEISTWISARTSPE